MSDFSKKSDIYFATRGVLDMGQVRIGCAGFPQRQALCFETLDVVEVQATFYKPPQVKTVQRWREEAPKHFQFTMKAWQLITHSAYSPTYQRSGLTIPDDKMSHYGSFRPTEEVHAAWERTCEVALGMQAAFVVFQCPASFTPVPGNVRNLRRFFSDVDRHGLRFTWEPRGDWPETLIAELCKELDLLDCVDPFLRSPVTTGTCYFRLHGRNGYDYIHTDEELDHLAAQCRDYDDAWVVFNNTAMWDDAARLRQRLQSS
jgi:uncharacterized protein YecE (DUF72 family)